MIRNETAYRCQWCGFAWWWSVHCILNNTWECKTGKQALMVLMAATIAPCMGHHCFTTVRHKASQLKTSRVTLARRTKTSIWHIAPPKYTSVKSSSSYIWHLLVAPEQGQTLNSRAEGVLWPDFGSEWWIKVLLLLLGNFSHIGWNNPTLWELEVSNQARHEVRRGRSLCVPPFSFQGLLLTNQEPANLCLACVSIQCA